MRRSMSIAFVIVGMAAAGILGIWRFQTAEAKNVCGSREIWVNDWQYGSVGGGFYWDPLASMVWTPTRDWHYFAPEPSRANPIPLWVNQLDYGSLGGGYYWDPVSGQVWTSERGWHVYGVYGCRGDVWTLDQEQPIIDGTAGGVFIGGASEQKLAQTLTAGIAGRLVVVRLPIRCELDSRLTLQIQGVEEGHPNGTVLASQSFAGAGLPIASPAAPELHGFGFVFPPTVVAGTQYAIVATAIGRCVWSQGPIGDPYPAGNTYFDAHPNPPGWVGTASGRLDLPFQEVVEP